MGNAVQVDCCTVRGKGVEEMQPMGFSGREASPDGMRSPRNPPSLRSPRNGRACSRSQSPRLVPSALARLAAVVEEEAKDVEDGDPPSRPLCKHGFGCQRSDPLHWAAEGHPGDPDHPLEEPLGEIPEIDVEAKLPRRGGSYSWVRRANGPQDRETRCATAALTLKVCRAQGYDLGELGKVELQRIKDLPAQTRFVTNRDIRVNGRDRGYMPLLSVAEEPTLLEAALPRLEAGARVAVLCPVSAYRPCGGFRSGDRHSLEEAMCVQTTLAVSLQRAFWLGYGQPPAPTQPWPLGGHSQVCKGPMPYIPEDGVVLSPGVEVFREGFDQGYRFMTQASELAAVISMAMPNRNPDKRDIPMDAPADSKAYGKLLRAKFRAVLGAARIAKVGVLVVPGMAGGNMRNDPREVGLAFADVLREPTDDEGLREVVIAGADWEMVEAALGVPDDWQVTGAVDEK